MPGGGKDAQKFKGRSFSDPSALFTKIKLFPGTSFQS